MDEAILAHLRTRIVCGFGSLRRRYGKEGSLRWCSVGESNGPIEPVRYLFTNCARPEVDHCRNKVAVRISVRSLISRPMIAWNSIGSA